MGAVLLGPYYGTHLNAVLSAAKHLGAAVVSHTNSEIFHFVQNDRA